jgi:hypothetical protein
MRSLAYLATNYSLSPPSRGGFDSFDPTDVATAVKYLCFLMWRQRYRNYRSRGDITCTSNLFPYQCEASIGGRTIESVEITILTAPTLARPLYAREEIYGCVTIPLQIPRRHC